MPYAANSKISHDYFPGSIEISEEQYSQALDAKLRGGDVSIDGGYSLIENVGYPALDPVIPLTPDEIEAQERERWKRERALLVESIKVTTASGLVFDGDEVSQGRMARAILGLQAQPAGATVKWVLTDNSVVLVAATELTEALTLAGLRQTELWVET